MTLALIAVKVKVKVGAGPIDSDLHVDPMPLFVTWGSKKANQCRETSGFAVLATFLARPDSSAFLFLFLLSYSPSIEHLA